MSADVKLAHPSLPGQPIWVAAEAVPFYTASGWAPAEPDPDPAPAAPQAPSSKPKPGPSAPVAALSDDDRPAGGDKE